MKVLFITNHYLEEDGGGSFASRAFINAFSEIADSCMILYPDQGNSVDNYINKKCIKTGIIDNRSKFKKVIDVYRGRINRYLNIALKIINNFNPDIVVFDSSNSSAGLIKKAKRMGTKTIVIHHNYQIEYYQGTNPYNGVKHILLSYPFLHHMKRVERTAIQSSDLNLTLTDQDTNLLQKHYDPNNTARILTLGCFESTKETIPSINKECKNIIYQNSNLCFVISGSLNTYQTEVSLYPFLEYIYPQLLKMLPESKLIIAGREPSEKIKIICANFPSISLISNPENMQEIIAQADVYICPTSIGGGLKLRVMDGLKAGLPVLSHAVSARGYDEFIKANCLFTYENQTSFMDSLEKIIIERNKGNLKKEIIQRIYKSIFSFESGVARLREILVSI